MTYTVKEIFLTLQGEGAQAGRRAVFCRFAGCNLWTGREKDRAKAICQFCDTDFVGTDGTLGGKYRDAGALAERPDDPRGDLFVARQLPDREPQRGDGHGPQHDPARSQPSSKG